MKNRKPWFCQDCRVEMEYIKKFDFFKCPKCGSELWPADTKENSDEVVRMMEELAPTHQPRECLPIYPEPTGGSTSKSKKRKSMTKESLATINQKLYSET